MSEDETQNLPDVLERLEIVAATHLMKTSDDNLPITENPFFYKAKVKEKEKSCDPAKLFGPKCECSRRRLSSAGSSGGASSTSSNVNGTANTPTIEHSIINHTQFKHKHNANKFSLKDPILQVIQSCMHYNHVRHKKSIAPSSASSVGSAAAAATVADDLLTDCPTLDALRLDEEQTSSNFSDKAATKFMDFKALVQECDIISCASATQSIGNILSVEHRKHAKQFTTIQSGDLRKGKDHRKCKKSQSKVSTQSTSRQNPSTSSSCSQQARINASATTACDVTIDELASYFETFVHIPKKMSSMAEMMYI